MGGKFQLLKIKLLLSYFLQQEQFEKCNEPTNYLHERAHIVVSDMAVLTNARAWLLG